MPSSAPAKVEVVLRPDSQKQAKIDRYGECDRKRRLWKPRTNPYQAECDELELEILGWAANDPPNKSTVLAGKRYQVEITVRGWQHKFSDEAKASAYKLLKRIKGLDMLAYFSVTLAEAKVRLGKAWLEANVPKLQTGPRELNVAPLGEAGKARPV
jgi:hypothetical protein